MRVSLANRLAAPGVVIQATTSAAGYPASNVATAHRPFKPWQSTTTTGDQVVYVDAGSIVVVDGLAAINAGFTGMRWLADSVPTMNSVDLLDSGVLPITRNLWNGRHHGLYRPSWAARRYYALYCSSPIPGATVYSLGGIWAGSLTESPDGIDWNYQPKPNRPKRDTALAGGARSRASLGNAFGSLTATRKAKISTRPAGLADVLRNWLELERQWMAADYALVTIEDGDPSQGMVMRVLDDESWDVGYGLAEAGLALEEVTGP